MGLLFIGYLFITNKTKLASTEIEKPIQFQITEDLSLESKFSVKKIERENRGMSQKDMAQVVKLVISKMKQKREKQIDDELYTRELLKQDSDALLDSFQDIDLEKLDREHIVKQNMQLKDIDHYNKIIVSKPKDEKYTNDKLTQLSSKLSFIVDDGLSDINSSSYTDEIIKEIMVRSNEMRTIIVQKGDTLSKIAKRAYDNYDAYVKIFEANPEVIKNPNQIFVGQRLRIPL